MSFPEIHGIFYAKKLSIHFIRTIVRHEYPLVQMHLKSQLHFGNIETTFGTCNTPTCVTFDIYKLHVLPSVHANYIHYFRYTQTTCTTFGTCKLHAIHSVPVNYMFVVFFFVYYSELILLLFYRLNPTGKYKNRPNIMKISGLSHSVHLFFVYF